ncbi:TPA: hypothetical protein KEY88_004787 [Serratia marcescens]|uniref:hypothetical protein n=1 Tax=Serratia marcescens TaxID=615 RepID=UPI001B93527C|nr:hypothetical protein [Serratia marcescens]MBS3894812.1 hypothetical protein [Serratia marcescens]HBC7422035.1 hypothetical protein [Serratia marcescens]
MAKKSGSKTCQGMCGMTMAQGNRLTRQQAWEYGNVQKSVAEYRTADGNIQMPLNRSMRRHAKHMGFNLKKATK